MFSYLIIREMLLLYIKKGDDIQALGSLSLFATLLQTKGMFLVFLSQNICIHSHPYKIVHLLCLLKVKNLK
jgi:hypothetical protein